MNTGVMQPECNKVIFWGFSPEDGKRVYMLHNGSLFVPLGALDRPTYSIDTCLEKVFWGGLEHKERVCIHALEPGQQTGVYKYYKCLVDVTLAKQRRSDVSFSSFKCLQGMTGLDSLVSHNSMMNWAALMFIEQHIRA